MFTSGVLTMQVMATEAQTRTTHAVYHIGAKMNTKFIIEILA